MCSSTQSGGRPRAISARKPAFIPVLLLALAAGPAGAGQIDSATFFLLSTGMSESEVLVRAGPPDLVSPPGVAAGAAVSRHPPAVERWHYIPDRSEHDPHLTIITLTHGRVFNLERRKIHTRDGLPEPPQAEAPRTPSDSEIVRRRLQRTLSAAERYARTRARLKREDLELRRAAAGLPRGDGKHAPVYRDTLSDGGTYYGDRPVEEAQSFASP